MGDGLVVLSSLAARWRLDPVAPRALPAARSYGLRESEARLAAVVEQLAEGLVIFDTAGRATHWNPAALAMHGFAVTDAAPSAEQMNRLFEISDVETGEPLPAEERVVQRILRGETVHNVERRVRRTDEGWEKVFTFSGSVVHGDGDEKLIVVVIADVTERRESEERQRLLMREVDHRAKNALAVVQSVVKLTRAGTMSAFREAVEGASPRSDARTRSLPRTAGTRSISRRSCVRNSRPTRETPRRIASRSRGRPSPCCRTRCRQ